MRFCCLLPVRDEADIIGQCLQHALQWSDAIYVFDTGSVDHTWEIVQDIAARERRVVPLRKDPVYFSETKLRGWMFHQARQTMRTGDWFLRMDADEFHHLPPPEFVKRRLRPHETIVYHQYYNFVLRESEAQMWERGEESLADRRRLIQDRRQWYQVSAYSEPRLCRYRETMRWPSTVSFPFNAGYVARARLPIRHYPHRDPLQLKRRCMLRAAMMANEENRSSGSFHHWAEYEWRKLITPDGCPGLQRWTPGTQLTEVVQMNHLTGFPKRMTQRLAHAFLLPLLDRTRRGWNESDYPQLIPDDVVRRLQRELGEGAAC